MAAELVLYDNPGSSNARKVRFLLAELGLPYRSVEVPIVGPRPGWYSEIHPFATVPTLVDDDLTLVESNTILRYLARREGRDDVYPADPAGQARVDQLLDVLSLVVRPPLWELEKRTYYAHEPEYCPSPPSPAEVAAAREALEEVLAGWEGLIASDGYATGTFSIADVAATARLWLLPKIGVDLGRFPKTRAMMERVGSRPTFPA
jgi:glutathione S-transferase